MATLSPTLYSAMRRFLEERARPLEAALARNFLDGAPAAEVLAALACFQNADGGFGRALEPDLRLPDSSALATTVGLQYLRAVGAGSDEPLVQGAIGYLVATIDPEALAWPSCPVAANDHPHAPWWQRDPAGPTVSEGEAHNPRPEALGYLYDHCDLVPKTLLDQVSDSTFAALRAAPQGLDMHALYCYIRLAESPGVPEGLRTELLERLRAEASAVVEVDPTRWEGYCLRPLDVVEGPQTALFSDLVDAAERQLGWELARLDETGCVRPAWEWGGVYPDAWACAATEWSGWLTLHLLRRLQAFGRLPNGPVARRSGASGE